MFSGRRLTIFDDNLNNGIVYGKVGIIQKYHLRSRGGAPGSVSADAVGDALGLHRKTKGTFLF